MPERYRRATGAAFALILFWVSLKLKRNSNSSILHGSSRPSFSSINSYLHHVASSCAYPAEFLSYGQSQHGRQLPLLKIGSVAEKDNDRASEKIVLLTSGLHGREFQAPLAVLLSVASLCKKQIRLPPNVSVVVAPLTNPDGYERARTTIRESRKTWPSENSPSAHNCTPPSTGGVDLNRNFPHTWINDTQNPCSATYGGKHSGSEPETTYLMKLIRSIRVPLFGHIDVHTFGAILFGDCAATLPTWRLILGTSRRIGYSAFPACVDPLSRRTRSLGGSLMQYVNVLGKPSMVMELAPRWTYELRAVGFFENKKMAPRRARDIEAALEVFIKSASGEWPATDEANVRWIENYKPVLSGLLDDGGRPTNQHVRAGGPLK